MAVTLILIPLLPLAAALLSPLPLGRSFAPGVTLAAAAAALVLAAWSAARVLAVREVVAVPGWVALDGLGATLLLLVTFVSLTAALFSWGYVSDHVPVLVRARSYYAHFNLFTFSLTLVPVVAHPALVWIAIEFTAVFSVLLVAFDRTHEALEAAWKYITLMFMGAAMALFGFFLLFWAQQTQGGGHYDWDGLRAIAPKLPPVLVLGAFTLIAVGFGTKVGFVPLHTWLPDAHSQAPSPVCALLSGVKTTTALYCILRLVPLLPAGRIGPAMQAVGLLSAGVAGFLLLQVTDYKRLFAFSTVEHMGIVFVAAGLGTTSGHYAAILQLVSHSITKSFCFLAAGAVLLATGTRRIDGVRGLMSTAPVAGTALLVGALAIGGAPPFAVFLSEFALVRAALAQGLYVTTVLLVLFIAVAFFGMLGHVNRMVLTGPAAADQPVAGAPAVLDRPVHRALPATTVLALVVAVVPVLVLGVYQPDWLHRLYTLAAAALAPTGAP